MDLEKYIYSVERLEREKYSLEGTINQIDAKINRLCARTQVFRSRNPISEEETKMSGASVIVILACIGWAIFGIYSISIAPKFFWELFFVFIVPAVAIVAYILFNYFQGKKVFNYNERVINEQYNEEQKRARQQDEYNRQIAKTYEQARNRLYQTYVKTCNLLRNMYGMGIIYEKYQYDLVAICMFAEYFKSGRCTTFEGHEGAYNLFEHEKRMNIIIGKLDEIITRLDRIEQNQYGLFMALNEIRNQQDRIISNLNSISGKMDRQIENAEYMRYDLSVMRMNNDIAMIYGMKYV